MFSAPIAIFQNKGGKRNYFLLFFYDTLPIANLKV